MIFDLKEQIDKYTHECIGEGTIKIIEKKSEFAWIDCYSSFGDYKGNNLNEDEIDMLALKLFTYLANWGMYSRGSFLMDYSYRIHYDAVKIIVAHADLYGMSYFCSKDGKLALSSDYENNIGKVMKLKESLEEEYSKYKGKANSKVSEILISKIMLGTLGCVPAYDTCFNNALTKLNIAPKTFSGKSLERVLGFFDGKKFDINCYREKLKPLTRVDYPDMKIIDMALWLYGSEKNQVETKE